MKTLNTLMLCLLLALLAPFSAAQADDKEALQAAFMKSFEADSFRVRMSDDGRRSQVATMEYQKPDRFRVVTDEAEMIAVGGTVYMVMGGQTMRIPMNVGNLVERFRTDERIRESQDSMRITAVERDTINGVAATRYDFEIDRPRSTNRAWVDASSGYLIRMEQTSGSGRRQSTTTMDYEDFGAVVVNQP